jgi:hypothetical protein
MEPMIRRKCVLLFVACAALMRPSPAHAQVIKAKIRNATPAWNKGIIPINRESYYNAIECGKQGGQDPPCVFWDTGLCKNEEFELTFYTGYKMVSYAVWNALRQGQPAPTPDFAEAQRTRVTVAVRALRASKNPVDNVQVRRDGKVVQPAARSVTPTEGRFTFDYPVWAPTTDIDLEVVAKVKPMMCRIEKSVLERMR